MKNNPLVSIQQLGQSPWYDNIQRSMIQSGALKQMIDNKDVVGLTSNPTIFEKAITGSNDYDQAINDILAKQPDIDAKSLFEQLAIKDIQDATDLLRGIYDSSHGLDGYASIEVSPTLAHDTAGSIAEGKRLYGAVNRPNVMIKVPATPEGLPAITALLGEGINVNVTLMFSLDDFDLVSDAYLAGLEQADQAGHDLNKISSVASYFISRIDTAVDKLLPDQSDLAGAIAIANAKLAYERLHDVVNSERFQKLKAKGARVQRLLWASTGTKNPNYADTLYVDQLIGPHTVNTMPHATVQAFKDHGQADVTLTKHLDQAKAQILALKELGHDIDKITAEVKQAGVEAFQNSFKTLLAAIDQKRGTLVS